MDEAERAFRDALHRVDSVMIPVPRLEPAEIGSAPVRSRAGLRWLAAAAAVAVVAGLGVWALSGRGGVVPAVPASAPSTSSAAGTPVLTGATWVAIELFGQAVEPMGEKVPFVRFDQDSTFTGGDPCNGVAGTYRLTGDELRLNLLGSQTAVGCNIPQQALFQKLLDGTRQASRTGDTLSVLDADGMLLGTFRATVAQPEPGEHPTPSVLTTAPTREPELGPPTVSEVVSVRIRNASGVSFDRVQVLFPDGQKVDYGPLRPSSATDYAAVGVAYKYSYVKVTTAGMDYMYQPIDFVGETPLKPGHYTYELALDHGRVDLKFEIDG